MNRNRFTLIGGVVAIILVVWGFAGCQFTCRDSFWDKDKKVIEVKP